MSALTHISPGLDASSSPTGCGDLGFCLHLLIATFHSTPSLTLTYSSQRQRTSPEDDYRNQHQGIKCKREQINPDLLSGDTASLPSPENDIQKNKLSTLKRELAVRKEERRTALRRIAEQKDYIFTLSNRLLAAENECQEIEHSISKAAEYQQNANIQENLRYECSVLALQDLIALRTNDSRIAYQEVLRPMGGKCPVPSRTREIAR